jgi:hypothetical protein
MNDLNVVDNDLNLQPITRWLVSANNGDTQARARLYEAVYPVLRRMAASKPGVRIGATLSPTMVVSELFLKITGGSAMESQDRHHFFATCSRAMRFIITDFARTLASQPDQAQELLDIDAALVDLESLEPRLRELVELKFFGGLSHIEIGELHGRSERSVKRDWIRARAFLVARTSIDGYA